MPKKKHTISSRAKTAAERKVRRRQLHHDIHQDIYDFLHQPWHLTFFVIVMILVVSVIGQLLYPGNRALPFTMVQGASVGGHTQQEISVKLREQNEKLNLRFMADKIVLVETPLAQTGLTPRYGAVVDHATEYPWWQRLIPLSFFVKPLLLGNITVSFTTNMAVTTDFVKTVLLPKCQLAPVSATIGVKEGQLVLQEGGAGRQCSEKELMELLATLRLSNTKGEVRVPFKKSEAKRSSEDIQALFTQVQQNVQQGLVIKAEDKTFTVPRDRLLPWLLFEEGEDGKLRLGVYKDKIHNYVEEINREFLVSPVPSRTEMIDGVQHTTEPGVEGKALDVEATTNAIGTAIMEGKHEVAATVVALSPETEYQRRYSPNDAGLGALLKDLVHQKGDYGITVIELDGRQRRAESYGSQSFLTASTYKIFVAYTLLKEIEAGRMRWDQEIRPGMDTEACWREMLKYSLNPCALTFADMLGGWGRIQGLMHEQGLLNTYLSSYEKRSTPNDEALYFVKLELGELLQGASREKLLGTLKTQIYRDGIPTGVGYETANKIGFYNGYLHDIGIVYAPQGRYVLAVMTYGGTWWGIADVARQVQNYLAQ